jgi:sulfite dehydrogenase (cytochrome) subunit B
MNRTSRAFSVLLSGWIWAAPALGGEETIRLTDAPGHDMVASRCVTCHSLDYITMNAPVLDRAGWERTIRKMIDRFGAPVTDEEYQQILDYLAGNY